MTAVPAAPRWHTALLVALIVTVAVVIHHGAPLESPADPTSSYVARPEWYALPLFQLRMYFEGPLEIVATGVLRAEAKHGVGGHGLELADARVCVVVP